MKKIDLKGISETLSEKEFKNVMGGSSGGCCDLNCPLRSSCPNYSGTCYKIG